MNSSEKSPFRVYPCTVTPSRYSGTYEGGTWVAFNCHPDELPEEAFGDDVECMGWWIDLDLGMHLVGWRSHTLVAGRGKTPNDAVLDLQKRL